MATLPSSLASLHTNTNSTFNQSATMASTSTTLSPVTTSQVIGYEKPSCNSFSYLFVLYMRVTATFLSAFSMFSCAPARMGWVRLRIWSFWSAWETALRGGRVSGWRSRAWPRAFLRIECQTWERGSWWICCFWVLFRYPLSGCCYHIHTSLFHQGKLFAFWLILHFSAVFFPWILDCLIVLMINEVSAV